MKSIDRKRTITWGNPKDSARDATSISGLNYLKSIKNGTIEPPPVAMLVGYKISDVNHGYAAFELKPEEFHYNPFSTVHGGLISTLLDTTMTASVLSTLKKGISCSTIEFKVNFIRPVTSNIEILRCEAREVAQFV